MDDFVSYVGGYSFFGYLIAFCVVFFYIRSYFKGPSAYNKRDLHGKVVVITGANSGIGLELARDFWKRKPRVLILACRDGAKGVATREQLQKELKNTEDTNVYYWKLDLNSFQSIRKFASVFLDRYEQLDLLINNAGVMMIPELSVTEDGYEEHFQTNFLGPMHLTTLLTPVLAKGAARIVNLSAVGYRLGKIDFDAIASMYKGELKADDEVAKKAYVSSDAYSMSKLANMLWSHWLVHVYMPLHAPNVKVMAVHPGVCDTNAMRHMPLSQPLIRFAFAPFIKFLMKTARDGAQTVIHCALADETMGLKLGEPQNVVYFADCQAPAVDEIGRDPDVAARLCDSALTRWTKKASVPPPAKSLTEEAASVSTDGDKSAENGTVTTPNEESKNGSVASGAAESGSDATASPTASSGARKRRSSRTRVQKT